MYEESKFKLNINWKSLLIKLGILLLLVFIVCFIVFHPWNKEKNSLSININNVKKAAIKYYQSNMPLKEIGDYDKVLLRDLIDADLTQEQELDGNACNSKESYAYLTKTRDNEYVLKINMVCGKEEETKVLFLTNKDLKVEVKEETEDKENIIIEELPEDTENNDNSNENIEEDSNKEEDKKPEKPNNDNKNENNKKPESDKNNEVTKPTKVVRYKHIKYGEWVEGNLTGKNIENDTKTVKYYNYCKDNYCVEDTLENENNYVGYDKIYVRTETINVYRRIYTITSNMCCIKGFINTGIIEEK